MHNAEVAEVASLRSLGHRVDKSIGKRERAIILAVMGAIWAALYLGLGYATRARLLTSLHLVFILVNVSYGAFLVVAMRVWRKMLTETEVNKRFMWTLWSAFLAGAVLWPAAWLIELPFSTALAMTMLLYATVVWMSSAAVDSALKWACWPYVAGFAAALAFPDYAWEAMGLATFGAMATASAVWRPTAPTLM